MNKPESNNQSLNDAIEKCSTEEETTTVNWRDRLPEGFEPIYQCSRPFISFDAKRNRFYVSSGVFRDTGLRLGNHIAMAYNKIDDSLIIITSGGTMMIDKKSYITSKDFAEKTGFKTGQHKYEFIPEESTTEFKLFRRIKED
ncbi:hypothetical protein [Mammaliicoccus sciuri]|uniref:hypothetical protein n=1 Tax=Mammaliicoccus sciuri TaxID=1296 RepID=UPI0034DCEAB3